MAAETPNPRVFPPLDIECVPEPIQKANEKARELGAAYEQASVGRAAARAAVDQADATDQAADAAAVAAGKPLPGAKAGPKAREALQEAERHAAAAERAFRDAWCELTDRMIGSRSEWLEALGQAEAREREAIREAIAEAGQAGDRLALLLHTRENLRSFHPSPKPLRSWNGVSWYEGRNGQATSTVRQARERASMRGLAHNESDIDRLAVEYELLVTGERPWAEGDEGIARVAA
ncbi:MAG: hypothetical protein U0R26_11910 [Solirubrobacterales bacterium]